jgi:outer membrane protein assembly factor BamB
MDARSGATLWKTTWPKRTYNLQTHKHRGTFGVPLVASGKVFYPDFHDGLKVMDAMTGKALWEFPKYEQPPDTKSRPSGPKSQSPLLFGETLVWHFQDTTYGFEAITGRVLWENKKPYIFVAGQRVRESQNIRLIHADSGKTLWQEDLPLLGTYEGMFANVLAIQGDLLVAFRHKLPPPNPNDGKIDKSKVTHHVNAWKLTTKGTKHLWEDEHLPPDEGPHLAIAKNVVYAVGDSQLRCLDLQTGKVLGEIHESGFPGKNGHYQAPGSNPLVLVAGDQLFLSPEGQHGVHGFALFDADPGKLTLQSNREQKWQPPHATTTAYSRQPIVNPIVDGRIFFRGGNGIYCYDLRK